MRRVNLLYLMGMLVIALCVFAGPAKGTAAYRDYVATVSTGGLNQPAKVAVDPVSGDVYVTDAGNKAVKKYGPTGTYDGSFSLSVSGIPVGIAVTANYIFVGDDTNDCVWIYNKSGALADLAGTGTSHKLGGASGTALKMPNTVTIAPSDHIFVVDGDSDKVYIYNANGTANSNFCASGSTSTGTSIQAYFPSGLAMANSTVAGATTTQYFYLGDQGNYKVQKLSYAYTTASKAITTAPTYVLSIGSGARGDGFGSFIRVSDLAWDGNFSRLVVLDSLQMVGQVFSGDATTSTAFNYSGGVQGYLNVPTGAAFGSAYQTLYVANNQNENLVMFSTQDGSVPTIFVTDPAGAVTPCTANYTVSYNGTDSDSSSVTVSLYYYNVSTPGTKYLFATQTKTVTAGAYSGTASMDLAGSYPNFMLAGTYGVYGVVADAQNNTANSTAPGTVGITVAVGSTSYTCSMEAKYGLAGLDSDGDGLTNGQEIEATHPSNTNAYVTNPGDPDTDHDGLNDGNEEIVYTTNPRKADSDGGSVIDGEEVNSGTDANDAADDTQRIIVVPLVDISSGKKTRVVLKNIDSIPETVYLNFYDSTGAAITTNPASPIAINLPAKGSTQIDPSAYFSSPTVASLEVTGSTYYVHGVAEIYTQDMSFSTTVLTKPVRHGLSTYYFVGGPFQGAQYNTEMYLHNPTPSTVTFNLTFYAFGGGATPTYTFTGLTVPAHGTYYTDLETLGVGTVAGAIKNGQFIVDVTSAGYLNGYTNTFNPVFAYSYVIRPFDDMLPAGSIIHFPFAFVGLFSGENFDGSFLVNNPFGTAVTYDVNLYNPNGTLYGSILNKTANQHGLGWAQYSSKIATGASTTVEVTIKSGRGFAIFPTNATNFGYCSDGIIAGSEHETLDGIMPTDPLTAGVAYNNSMVFKNVGDVPATVTYNYYNQNGSLAGTKTATTAVHGYTYQAAAPITADGTVEAVVTTPGAKIAALETRNTTTSGWKIGTSECSQGAPKVRPAAIADLAAAAGSAAGQVNLTWTAVGAALNTGNAKRYIVRYSTSAIDVNSWDNATEVSSGLVTPQAPGSHESMTVSGLTSSTKYYFAVKAVSPEENTGAVSVSPWVVAP